MPGLAVEAWGGLSYRDTLYMDDGNVRGCNIMVGMYGDVWWDDLQLFVIDQQGIGLAGIDLLQQ